MNIYETQFLNNSNGDIFLSFRKDINTEIDETTITSKPIDKSTGTSISILKSRRYMENPENPEEAKSLRSGERLKETRSPIPIPRTTPRIIMARTAKNTVRFIWMSLAPSSLIVQISLKLS